MMDKKTFAEMKAVVTAGDKILKEMENLNNAYRDLSDSAKVSITASHLVRADRDMGMYEAGDEYNKIIPLNASSFGMTESEFNEALIYGIQEIISAQYKKLAENFAQLR